MYSYNVYLFHSTSFKHLKISYSYNIKTSVRCCDNGLADDTRIADRFYLGSNSNGNANIMRARIKDIYSSNS